MLAPTHSSLLCRDAVALRHALRALNFPHTTLQTQWPTTSNSQLLSSFPSTPPPVTRVPATSQNHRQTTKGGLRSATKLSFSPSKTSHHRLEGGQELKGRKGSSTAQRVLQQRTRNAPVPPPRSCKPARGQTVLLCSCWGRPIPSLLRSLQLFCSILVATSYCLAPRAASQKCRKAAPPLWRCNFGVRGIRDRLRFVLNQ